MAEQTPGNPALALEHEPPRPSGVTNRPIEEEEKEQSDLPPRGERKGSAHA